MKDITIRVPIQIELHIRCSTAQDVGPSLLTLSVEPKVEPTSVGRLPRQPRKPFIKPDARLSHVTKTTYSVDGGKPLSAADAAAAAGVSVSMIYLAAKTTGRCKGHTVVRIDKQPSDSEGE